MASCALWGQIYKEDAMDIDQVVSPGNFSPSSPSSISTHPSSFTAPAYYSEFQDFWDKSKIAPNRAVPIHRQPSSSRVGVLLLSFEDGDLNVLEKIQTLEGVFQSTYGYEAETWSIPTTESEEELSKRIYQFRKKYCQENRVPNNPLPLLILYYGGHAVKPASGHNTCLWSNKRDGQGALLNWTTVQPILFDAFADVLVILDCCYPSSAACRAGANNVGTKETLATCGPSSLSFGVGGRSFTSALATELWMQTGKLVDRRVPPGMVQDTAKIAPPFLSDEDDEESDNDSVIDVAPPYSETPLFFDVPDR